MAEGFREKDGFPTKVRKLNAKEKKAIAALEAVAGIWPDTLWLFIGSGTLHVMQTGPDGKRAVLPHHGNDGEYIVTTVDIPNDGGDF